ncbi:MAG TPA: penicillin-binding protein 2, partial [Longimicrobiaceae bacterium]|nr:penicillin-binding protein 2 [Longimicrobiaceae bacterium]
MSARPRRGAAPRPAARRAATAASLPPQPRHAPRRKLLLGAMCAAALLIVGRAVQLQGFEGEKWAAVAREQQNARVPLAARRGAIYDRDGVPLALSHETYRVSVAPHELNDPREAAKRLREVLGLGDAEARRATSRERRWVVLPGRATAEQRQQLAGVRGLHFERRLERFYPQGDIGREVIGAVSGDGRALGGVEQQFEALLAGTPGYSVVRRDARGAQQPTISLPVVPPTDGADVYLTIDFDLQEIADGALRAAIETNGAAGGDMLITDPRTGELLAAVSRRNSRSRSLSVITEPYEPGSTLKPFFVAGLLADGRATLADEIFAENGRWVDENGRRFSDSHAEGWLTLRDALRYSSNIAMAKLTARVAPGEQYEWLRDFGFGTPTGVEYPAESSGRLRRPASWSKLSPASLAIGYELSVTPLQLVMAYGALANGGVLMEPRLLREVRGPEGAVLERAEPLAVRRVLTPEVTRQITDVLVSVVEEGTATRAALSSFEVAGKTGTARRTGSGGRYESGSYTSTFIGYFPARDPQIAIFVKLDQPRTSIYGGATAAPVTREALQAMLATRPGAPLDGRSLLLTRRGGEVQPSNVPERPRRGSEPPSGRDAPYVFVLDEGVPHADSAATMAAVAVPEVAGLPLRDAVRRLHAAGL